MTNLRRDYHNGRAIGWTLIGIAVLGIFCCGLAVEMLGLR